MNIYCFNNNKKVLVLQLIYIFIFTLFLTYYSPIFIFLFVFFIRFFSRTDEVKNEAETEPLDAEGNDFAFGLRIPVAETPEPVPVVEPPVLPRLRKSLTEKAPPVIAISQESTTYTAGSYAQQFRTATWSTSFTPMHFVSLWKDDNHKDHITVAFSVPSGLSRDGLSGKLFPSVSDDGKHLVVKCLWPNILGNLTCMERGWQREPGVTDRQMVNMIMSAESEVAYIRRTLGIAPQLPLYSEALIKLHVECERDIKKMLPIKDSSGGIVLYVVLKVHSKLKDDNNFSFHIRDVVDDSDDSSTGSLDEVLKPVAGISTLTAYEKKKSVSSANVVSERTSKRAKAPPKGHSDYNYNYTY